MLEILTSSRYIPFYLTGGEHSKACDPLLEPGLSWCVRWELSEDDRPAPEGVFGTPEKWLARRRAKYHGLVSSQNMFILVSWFWLKMPLLTQVSFQAFLHHFGCFQHANTDGEGYRKWWNWVAFLDIELSFSPDLECEDALWTTGSSSCTTLAPTTVPNGAPFTLYRLMHFQ